MRVALIGDHDQEVLAHRAIPTAIELASSMLDVAVVHAWIGTDRISQTDLSTYDALWCVPASPYRDKDGALAAIHYARTRDKPFLGTCGGYQHAVLEYARNVLGVAEADTTEENEETPVPLISSLVCGLYDATGPVRLQKDSRAAQIFQSTRITEAYHCGYGVNPEYLPLFQGSDLVFSGFDDAGDPRVFELRNHRFFLGTAFQPERSALKRRSHPLIRAFIQSGVEHATETAA